MSDKPRVTITSSPIPVDVLVGDELVLEPPVSVDTFGSRVWVNPRNTILVRLWTDGTLEVAFRETPDDVWGPAWPFTPELA